MSWKASAFAKELITGITRSEKLLLMVLADYHNTEREGAFPGRERLAKECLMSERQVTRSVQGLKSKGILEVERDPSSQTNFYRFVGLDTGTGAKMSPQDKSGTGDRVAPPGDAAMAPAGDRAMSPKPPCSRLLTPKEKPKSGDSSEASSSPEKQMATPPPHQLASKRLSSSDSELVTPNTAVPQSPPAKQANDMNVHGMGKGRGKNPAVEPWYGMFQAAYDEVAEDGLSYRGLTKDFTQLADFLNTPSPGPGKPSVREWLTEERWQRGLENYFCSEMTGHTLADFCVRFRVFHKSPLDRFRQPMDAPAPKRKVEDEDDDEGRKAIRRLAELRSEPPVDFAAEKKRWLAAQEAKRNEAEKAAGEREGRDGQSG